MPIMIVVAALTLSAAPAPKAVNWRKLQSGVEYGQIRTKQAPRHGDGHLHIVRIDPSKAKFVVNAVSQVGGENRTAAQWADERRLVAVINAGMYDTDFSTHVGRLRVGRHVNSEAWNGKYKSVFVLSTDRTARVVDARSRQEFPRAQVVVQNLRLIAGPGKNVWGRTKKRWSEAALAMDEKGRILFVFSRTPYSMWAFNNLLLNANLGITHAQHLEGGPEASLSIRGKNLRRDFSGSYETGFNENDDNSEQWALPNVIGVIAE